MKNPSTARQAFLRQSRLLKDAFGVKASPATDER
jgi:hypothetical protein